MLELSDNIRKQIPENIDYEQTIKIMMSDTSPLKTVLLQEVGLSVCFLDIHLLSVLLGHLTPAHQPASLLFALPLLLLFVPHLTSHFCFISSSQPPSRIGSLGSTVTTPSLPKILVHLNRQHIPPKSRDFVIIQQARYKHSFDQLQILREMGDHNPNLTLSRLAACMTALRWQ